MREADPAALFKARFALGQRLAEVQARKLAHQGAVFAADVAMMTLAEPPEADVHAAMAMAEARQRVVDARAAMAAADAEIEAIEAEIASIDRAIAIARPRSNGG